MMTDEEGAKGEERESRMRRGGLLDVSVPCVYRGLLRSWIGCRHGQEEEGDENVSRRI